MLKPGDDFYYIRVVWISNLLFVEMVKMHYRIITIMKLGDFNRLLFGFG